ncbi:MAG: hypothetical protein ABIS36_25200 [Chryseolinea sp.]
MNNMLGTFSLLFFGIVSAAGQHDKISIKSDEKEVPVRVVKSFKKDFVKADNVDWNIITGAVVSEEYSVRGFSSGLARATFYAVNFTEGEVKEAAIYDHYGKLVQSKWTIEEKALPDGVRRTVQTDFPGFAPTKSVEAVTGKERSVSHYRVELKSGDLTKLVALDASGRILKEK